LVILFISDFCAPLEAQSTLPELALGVFTTSPEFADVESTFLSTITGESDLLLVLCNFVFSCGSTPKSLGIVSSEPTSPSAQYFAFGIVF